MEKEKKLVLDNALGLIIKHFNLKDETIDSLREKLTWKFETKRRIVFEKKRDIDSKYIGDVLENESHKRAIEVLRKYGTEEIVQKYITDENYKDCSDERVIEMIYAQIFIVCPKEEVQTVENRLSYRKKFDLWEFEEIKGSNGWFLIYN